MKIKKKNIFTKYKYSSVFHILASEILSPKMSLISFIPVLKESNNKENNK